MKALIVFILAFPQSSHSPLPSPTPFPLIPNSKPFISVFERERISDP